MLRAFNCPSPKTQSPEWVGIWILGFLNYTSSETFWQTQAYENRTCTLRLVFLLMFFGEG